MKAMKAIAGSDISVGCMVTVVGQKRVYRGELLKPWTWLKFEVLPVVVPSVDHVAIVKRVD